MHDNNVDLKSKENKNDMLFILKELHLREKLSEKEYYKAIALVYSGEY